MKTLLMKNKAAWPVLGFAALFGLYTLYWFHMAGRIEGEVIGWAEAQAAEGTEVGWQSLKVTGYPYRLVVTIEDPVIDVRQGNRAPKWEGKTLKIISQAWSFGHVILDFVGTQKIELTEKESPVGRPLARTLYTIDGSSMMMSMRLNGGRVHRADVDLEELVIDTVAIGAYRPADLPKDITHLEVARAQIHSRVRGTEESEADKGAFAHDFYFEANEITSDREVPEGFEETLSRLALNFTRTSDELPGLHNGSLKITRDHLADDAQGLTLHEMSVDWQPVTLNLSGKLGSKNGRDPSGTLYLNIKGHKELVRALEEAGEMEPTAVLIAGALFGILEVAAKPEEDGSLNIPLKVSKGEVRFHVIPLFHLRDLGIQL